MENSQSMTEKPENFLESSNDKTLHPTWAGVNFRTTENVCFATQDQLLYDYNACLRAYGVSEGVLSAWTNWTYSGEATSDGIPDGEGKATILGGIMKYIGKYKKGLMHGQGRLEFSTGLSYEGQFFYNCIHGTGTYKWLNGANYCGEVLDGLPNGAGIMRTDEWCEYKGKWLNGLRHEEVTNKGTLTYGKLGESVYYGQWESDYKHGEGSLVYKSGSTYRGCWFKGKRQGFGQAVLVTQSVNKKPDISLMHRHWRLDAKAVQIYKGEWTNDLPHGSGTDIWADDSVEENGNILRNTYTGSFNEGKRNGYGVFNYATGALFKGIWKNGQKEGHGCLVYPDGTLHYGHFSRDRYSACKMASAVEKEDIYLLYSYFPNNEKNPSYLGRTRALTMEQLWQFCHDLQVVKPGLGLAQIDFLLRTSSFSWDSASELHFPKRQFLYREFLEIIIKLAREKHKTISKLEIQVNTFLEASVLRMDACGKESPYTFISSDLIQKQFFNVTLREVGTSDGTIKIAYLIHFFLRFGPDLVVNQARVVGKLVYGLYYVCLGDNDDFNAFMDYDINLRECELCLYLIAMEHKIIPGGEPKEIIRKVLVEVIVPNLSTSLDVILNEPVASPSKKGKPGDKGKKN
ncbi:hypothetical protein SELMODRAFT_410285 [Selaginella moellendorffii]|uniref:VPS9 domain-containing protein n=1 Tax=Selaginella moellendorffii TaxID=88036 RepID=D8RE97_SELML|nr:hypothetical protein SELMODRAFT_410285 [Selaginella moellendorffii]